MAEICKTKDNLNQSFMNNIFTERDSYYNLRSANHLVLPKGNATTLGIDCVKYRGYICGPYCKMKLKILTHFLSSRGKLNYGKEVLAHADFAKHLSRT